MDDSTPRTIEIPLTKGYVAIVDEQDADLALLKWHASCNRVCVYARTSNITDYKQKKSYLHRLILERIIGRSLTKHEYVDHKDGNSLNNTRENLRYATPADNVRNQHKQKNNLSGFKGVMFLKSRQNWVAQITVNNKTKRLGYFKSPEEAHEAYKKAAVKYYGEFARFD